MNCSICFEKIELSDKELKKNNKLKCEHNFHKKCILDWYYSAKANSDKCPLCRNLIIFKNNSIHNLRLKVRNKKIKKELLKNRYIRYTQNIYEESDDESINEDIENDEDILADEIFYSIFDQYMLFKRTDQEELHNIYNLTQNEIIDENYFFNNIISLYSQIFPLGTFNFIDDIDILINLIKTEEENYFQANISNEELRNIHLNNENNSIRNIDLDSIYEEDNNFRHLIKELDKELDKKYNKIENNKHIFKMQKKYMNDYREIKPKKHKYIKKKKF